MTTHTETNVVQWVDICNAAIMLGVANGERTKDQAFKIKALLNEQMKAGKVEQIGRGRYRLITK
jgi:hypothetical protein